MSHEEFIWIKHFFAAAILDLAAILDVANLIPAFEKLNIHKNICMQIIMLLSGSERQFLLSAPLY